MRRAVERLEHRRDVLVQQLALADAEVVVEILLEQLVTEPELRDQRRPDALVALLADEPMLPVEFLCQRAQQLAVVDLLQPADDLHRERLALDAGDRQDLLELLAHAADALLDHAFDAGGEGIQSSVGRCTQHPSRPARRSPRSRMVCSSSVANSA